MHVGTTFTMVDESFSGIADDLQLMRAAAPSRIDQHISVAASRPRAVAWGHGEWPFDLDLNGLVLNNVF